jgi:hypothetical protein
MLDQVDVEVDRGVEGHENVGDVRGRLNPIRPLHYFAMINLERKLER